LRFGFGASGEVREVLRNFLPALISRGVLQASAFIDTLIASLLPTGAVTGIANAQIIYTLPVSLFGMSVSAAELPAMSGAVEVDPAGQDALRNRLQAGLRQIAFFVVPSAVAFLALGDVIAAALLQTGRFRHSDAVYVWGILAGSAVGLLASTMGRLYSSAYYALRDTRTPLGYAVVHVSLSATLGYVFAVHAPHWVGVPSEWGAAGLTAAAGIAAWVEMLMLRNKLERRVGHTRLRLEYVGRLWLSAIAGAMAAWAVKLLLPAMHPALEALFVLGVYGVVFLTVTSALHVSEASRVFNRLKLRD
jgi:putative peptidoglycan lipid II flippase